MSARRGPVVIVLAALSLALLTGCQQPSPPLTSMQSLVSETADAVAAGDTSTAGTRLDALEAEVTRQLEAGEIDAAEADRIRAAIAALRADLATSGSDEATTTDDESPTDDPTTETVVESPTPTEQAPVDNSGPGNSGTAPGNPGNQGPGGDKGPGSDKPDKGKDK